MAKSRRSHKDQRANLRGKGFVAIPHVVMESAAWQHASLRARCILLDLVRRHNGYNNGKIAMSQREMSAAIGSSSFSTISKVTAELMQLGLIDLQWEGDTWKRKAREFRITWLPTGEHPNMKPAGDEWRAFSGATAVSADGRQSATAVSAARKFPATAVSAAKWQKPQKPVKRSNGAATAVSAHIDKPYRQSESSSGSSVGDGCLFDENGEPVGEPWPELVDNEAVRALALVYVNGAEQIDASDIIARATGIPASWIAGWLYDGYGMFPAHLDRVRDRLIDGPAA